MRDKGICQQCGKPGKEIDHIQGSNVTLENLQVLCSACNQQKMEMGLVPLQPTPERDSKFKELAIRVAASLPRRLCDDDINWQSQEKKLRKQRREKELGKQRREKVECNGCDNPVWKHEAQAVTWIEKPDNEDEDREIELTMYYCQDCQDAYGEDDYYEYTQQGTPIEDY